MDKTYNCPICGTEGFGSERLPIDTLDRIWMDLNPKAEWWYCANCEDHLPVTPNQEE